jgi:hypothetical protein
MADQKVTPAQQAMGFSIAAIVLATSVLDASIKRGDIIADDAAAVISRARKFLERRPPGVPDANLVYGVAGDALRLAEVFLAMAAAERPPQGSH